MRIANNVPVAPVIPTTILFGLGGDMTTCGIVDLFS